MIPCLPSPLFHQFLLYLRVLFHSLSLCLFCFLSFTPATSFYSLLIPFSFISLGYFCMLAQCVDRFWLLILMPSLLLVCFWYCLTAASVCVWSSKRERKTQTIKRLFWEWVCVNLMPGTNDNSIGLSLIWTKPSSLHNPKQINQITERKEKKNNDWFTWYTND